MLKRLGYTVLLLVACLRLSAAGPATDREGVTFRFHPPDAGITLINTERYTEKKTITSDGETKTIVTVTIEKTKTQVAKTARGYSITSIMLSIWKSVNDVEEEPDAFEQASMLVPMTMELDKNGRLTGLRGIEELRQQALELYEDDERDIFERIMTKERMEFLARSEWEAANGVLFGKTKKPGDTWQSKVKWYVFSPSLMPVTTDYSFIRMYNMAGHQCAMLKNVLKPDLKAAGEDLKKMFVDLEILPEGMEAEFSVQSYNEEYTQYLDPETFITWKEAETIEKKYTVTVAGRDIVTTEKSESTITTEVANDNRDT